MLENVKRAAAVVALVTGLVGFAAAEVVYLNNGDIIRGTVVAANNVRVTLKTAYGNLEIPKKDIRRIDYGIEKKVAPPPTEAEVISEEVVPHRPPTPTDRAVLAMSITGRSFWYAFNSPAERAADSSIRLRLYLGSLRACTLLDEKPDTVDGNVLYNSFTFSPTDSTVLETLEGYDCAVVNAEDGEVELRVTLPPSEGDGRKLIRMLYEINAGDRSFPRWVDVVSRSFSVEVERGKQTMVLLEQNSNALEYSGFFRKQMKNLELFQLNVLGTELKD